MKSKDEFRRTVMEKAARYEAERKARNKKIRESVMLCSICIAISLTVYLGSTLNHFLKNGDSISEAPETTDSNHAAMETPPPDNSEEPMFTDATPSDNAGVYHTTAPENTKRPTLETTCLLETTPEQMTTDGAGEQNAFILDFSCAGSVNDLSQVSSYESQALNSVSELEAYLVHLHNQYEIPQVTVSRILSAYPEEYFENHSLIAVKMKDSVYRVLGNADLSEYGRLVLTLQSTGKSDPLSGIQIYHYFITAKKENYLTIEINTEP